MLQVVEDRIVWAGVLPVVATAVLAGTAYGVQRWRGSAGWWWTLATPGIVIVGAAIASRVAGSIGTQWLWAMAASAALMLGGGGALLARGWTRWVIAVAGVLVAVGCCRTLLAEGDPWWASVVGLLVGLPTLAVAVPLGDSLSKVESHVALVVNTLCAAPVIRLGGFDSLAAIVGGAAVALTVLAALPPYGVAKTRGVTAVACSLGPVLLLAWLYATFGDVDPVQNWTHGLVFIAPLGLWLPRLPKSVLGVAAVLLLALAAVAIALIYADLDVYFV